MAPMAEGMVDAELASVARVGEGDASVGLDEEKVLIGLIDESKDQLTSENDSLLSPQRLYSIPSESKDTGLPNFLLQGAAIDYVQKDLWCQASQDKKERRRNVPDIDNSYHCRDEERETGLLGRREYRKYGDHVKEYIKNDSSSENDSMKEFIESSILTSSDRWHEVTGRNSDHEAWSNSKWSSRRELEENEKDSRAERKSDADKEVHYPENQSFVGSNRPSESDSRDKWRPCHHHEVPSGRSTIYPCTPGFDIDGGRAEDPNVGFVPGRGRGGLPVAQAMMSSAGSIGAAPPSRSEVGQGKCDLTVFIFQYTRSQLLDIYRKHKMLSAFDTPPEGLEDTPPLTQSNAITPLAMVSPNNEEKALLEGILKEMVTGSEASYIRSIEWNAGFGDPEIEVLDVSLKAKTPSYSFTEADPLGGFGAVALVNGQESSGVLLKISEHAERTQIEAKQQFGEEYVINGSEILDYSFKNSIFEGTLSSISTDAGSKLPDDSKSLDISFTDVFPTKMNYNYMSGYKHVEQLSPLEDLSLLDCDPQGYIQGPLLGMDITLFELGFSDTDLPVCLATNLEGIPFRPLGELMPKLNSMSRSTAEVYDGELSGPLDIADDGIVTNDSIAYSVGGSLDLICNRLAKTISECSESHQSQPRVLDHKVYIGPPNERVRLSELENSSGFPDSNAQLHDFTGQEAEEVLYTRRHMNGIESPLKKLANDIRDRSRSSNNHEFLVGEMSHASRPNNMKFSSNDRNALELFSYELEGSHGIQPLSSNLAIHDQTIIPAREEDCYHKHEQFNSMGDHPVANDLWPGAFVRSNSTNVPQHLMDNVNFTNFEPKFNRFGLEEYPLVQKFQKQYLQHLPSHQNLHAGTHSAKQGQGYVHHEISYQSIHNFEHFVQPQIQEEHHHHQFLRKQQQQQQLQLNCNQKLHQQLHRRMQFSQKKQEHEQQSLFAWLPRIFDRGFDSSLLKRDDDHFIASSPAAELVSASTSKGKFSYFFIL